jgi:hypothetical protein
MKRPLAGLTPQQQQQQQAQELQEQYSQLQEAPPSPPTRDIFTEATILRRPPQAPKKRPRPSPSNNNGEYYSYTDEGGDDDEHDDNDDEERDPMSSSCAGSNNTSLSPRRGGSWSASCLFPLDHDIVSSSSSGYQTPEEDNDKDDDDDEDNVYHGIPIPPPLPTLLPPRRKLVYDTDAFLTPRTLFGDDACDYQDNDAATVPRMDSLLSLARCFRPLCLNDEKDVHHQRERDGTAVVISSPED